MSQIPRKMIALVGLVVMVVIASTAAFAHEMTVKGTVAGVEPAKIQIKTGEEKKGVSPAWYPLNAKTKIMRDKTVVTFAQAKIVVGERAVLTVDHAANGTMTTLEVRLAAK